MPKRPFTFAVRGLHYGRYGGDSEDDRLSPLYLGYQGLVRGYDIGSFDANECGIGRLLDVRRVRSFKRQPHRDRGRRVPVPLLGLFSRRSFYGPFPLELAVFGDAGVAWTSDTKPTFAGGDRGWARSAGLALRTNIFGYAIAELDYVRPFDRTRKGWIWQFGLTPGF